MAKYFGVFPWMASSMSVVTLLMMATAQSADIPFPAYDVAAFCKKERDEKQCVTMQYTTRGMAAQGWLKTSPAVRTECAEVNRWRDYEVLWQCIDAHDGKLIIR